LPASACAAVPRPDDLVLDPMQRKELGRLGVLPRRHLDVVSPFAQERDQRSEERHLRGVRDVDPDVHALTTLAAGLQKADHMVYLG
jgi:hypothetical protein